MNNKIQKNINNIIQFIKYHFHFTITSNIVYKISSQTFANLIGSDNISFLTSNNVPIIGLDFAKHALNNLFIYIYQSIE